MVRSHDGSARKRILKLDILIQMAILARNHSCTKNQISVGLPGGFHTTNEISYDLLCHRETSQLGQNQVFANTVRFANRGQTET